MELTRRRLTQILAGTALAACAQQQDSAQEEPVVIDNPKGNFQFVKGSGPYSSGAVASPGFEVVHAIFQPLPELFSAFEIIEKHLEAAGRPLNALCGMELRIPKALSVEDFNTFNQPYIDRLEAWKLHVDGLNPVARTNVAPTVRPVSQPSVYGFSYTVPSDYTGKTFVVAGAGEFRTSGLDEDNLVARGDTSTAGLTQKAEMVLSIMTSRIEAMGASWADATQSNIYCIHDIHPLMAGAIVPALAEASIHGVRWFYAQPPVLEVEYEMDVRGVRKEIIVTP
ncbi:MAG: RidA family protein [Acidobacteria bacterium]|nr:RidA family protein [Acidobacteriota bacterium]